MLLYSQYIQMICAFALTVLFAAHTVKVWHILTLSFVVEVGHSFGGPAYSALLPMLVEPEDLANAISMNSIQFNRARIVGPTLGGLAYTVFGATWCFALNDASYVAVIISLQLSGCNLAPPKRKDQNAMFGADSNNGRPHVPMPHGSGERGIARVANSASSVKGRWVGFIQRGSELQSPW